jgi:hypothetical protein
MKGWSVCVEWTVRCLSAGLQFRDDYFQLLEVYDVVRLPVTSKHRDLFQIS